MTPPDIDVALVRALVREQFPRWAELPVAPVAAQGWDNRTFRLGAHLAVRLPSAAAYVPAVEKEDRWLPKLAERLPVPVPAVAATGRPGAGYPFPFSVRHWLPGEPLASATGVDRLAVAGALGAFLAALHRVPVHQAAPVGGQHSHFRGCHPSVFGDQVQHALMLLGDQVDVAACRDVWGGAVRTAWSSSPCWFHGDFAAGNVLTSDGQLSAVIDFGTCGVGDPACDLVLAWTYFTGVERAAFRDAVGLDEDTWRRARGWALWKALVTVAGLSSPDPDGLQWRVLPAVLRDPIVG